MILPVGVIGAGREVQDLLSRAVDFELRCVERATPFDFGGGMSLTTCGAEDLVIMRIAARIGWTRRPSCCAGAASSIGP